MKIALSAKKHDLYNQLDEHFGRAELFFIYNTETERYTEVSNKRASSAPQGAGIQTVELLIRNEVDTVVTGTVGPKAQKALEAAGITLYTTKQHTVAMALNELLSREETIHS